MPETATTRARRIFLHGTIRLRDPDPALTPDQVRAQYATTYPDLATATIETGALTDGVQTYTFKRAVGTKG